MRAARAMPDTLVIGIDPDANALRERSAAAARRADRGGLPNALFLVASAESLPVELAGIADTLRVTLPWGALLRGATAPEVWFTSLVGRLLAPGGTAEIVLSVVPSDHLPGLPRLDAAAAGALADRYASAGLAVHQHAQVTAVDVAAMGSSWAKRLNIPSRRDAWRLVVGVEPGPTHGASALVSPDSRTGPRHGDTGPFEGAARVRGRPRRSPRSPCGRHTR
jgi:16S rRNA (adenine(1408)-N(1))-methyltransferase